MSTNLFRVSAAGTWALGLKTDINVRNFSTFQMDEPVELGGTDTGPNPMEYVLAALNGCKSVMISLIAKELDFKFDGIEFDAKGIIDLRGLMGVEGVSPHFRTIRLVIKIKTEESEDRIQELRRQVEKRCPAYNLLADAGIEMKVNWEKVA